MAKLHLTISRLTLSEPYHSIANLSVLAPFLIFVNNNSGLMASDPFVDSLVIHVFNEKFSTRGLLYIDVAFLVTTTGLFRCHLTFLTRTRAILNSNVASSNNRLKFTPIHIAFWCRNACLTSDLLRPTEKSSLFEQNKLDA